MGSTTGWDDTLGQETGQTTANTCRMDEEREKLIRELHRRRQRMMAQELKTYLSPPEDGRLWVVIGAQPADRPGPGRLRGRPCRFPATAVTRKSDEARTCARHCFFPPGILAGDS